MFFSILLTHHPLPEHFLLGGITKGRNEVSLRHMCFIRHICLFCQVVRGHTLRAKALSLSHATTRSGGNLAEHMCAISCACWIPDNILAMLQLWLHSPPARSVCIVRVLASA